MEKTVEEIQKKISIKKTEISKEKYFMRKKSLPEARKKKQKIKQLRREISALKEEQWKAIMKNMERISKEDEKNQKKKKSVRIDPAFYDERVIKI